MIPADIKEMAKNDELVAELLATGGPFFYNDYKLIREGRVEEVARSRSKKARVASGFFLIMIVIYIVLLLAGVILQSIEENLTDDIIRIVSVVMYIAMAYFLVRQRNMATRLVDRIDAGEFSTD